MTNKQRKSEQTKSFSACETISLLYKNTFAKLYTDQCSLIIKCKALLVYSLVARRLVGLLRMLGSVSTMSEANNRFSLYVHMYVKLILASAKKWSFQSNPKTPIISDLGCRIMGLRTPEILADFPLKTSKSKSYAAFGRYQKKIWFLVYGFLTYRDSYI